MSSSVYYSSLENDPELMELVELFLAEMPDRMARLQDDYEQGQWEQLGRSAHQLKGAAGSYGFHQLTPYVAHLESAVRGGSSRERIGQCLEELIGICRRLRISRRP